MLNVFYNIFNTLSVTLWIIVIYIIKEQWTFDKNISTFIIGASLIFITFSLGGLSLYLTRFLGKDVLEKCIEIEQADATFLPPYVGYFLVAFSVSNTYQMLIAVIFISIFLYFVRWQYFNMTYLFFGYHCYRITTDMHIKIFLISKRELRSAEGVQFKNLYRINNTTYIERGR